MRVGRLVKLRCVFPYYCLHFWPQWSLLKWKARDPAVIWSSPLLLPYNNPTGSRLPPKTGSDSVIITSVSEVQACTHPASPWAFSLRGWPSACPPQILHEALGAKVKVKEGRMGTCSRVQGHPSTPFPSAPVDITHSTAYPLGRKVPWEESILISRN